MRQDDLAAELSEAGDDGAKGEVIQTSLIALVGCVAATPALQRSSAGKALGEGGCKQHLGSVKEVIKDNVSHLPVWEKHFLCRRQPNLHLARALKRQRRRCLLQASRK